MLKKIKRGIYLFVNKPTLFFERLNIHAGWLVWRLFGFPIKRRINGVIFEFDLSLSRWVKSMYFGWYDLDVIDIMEKILKPGDTFIDAGANIGYLSAIGAGFVGPTGQVHSFEPAFLYFQRLEKLAKSNPDYKIILNPMALGEKEDHANLVLSKENIGVNTINFDTSQKGAVKISIRRLDDYITQNALNNISLIKIDVEGFEFPVLKGLSKFFENTPQRPMIVVEVFPSHYPQYGATLSQLLEFMKKYGYKTYDIFNPDNEIDITKGWEGYNVIFKAFSNFHQHPGAKMASNEGSIEAGGEHAGEQVPDSVRTSNYR